MATALGLVFLIGGILAINRALQFLWRPFIGVDSDSSSDRRPD